MLYAGVIHESNTSHAWTIHESSPEELLVLGLKESGDKLDEHLPRVDGLQVQSGTTPCF